VNPVRPVRVVIVGGGFAAVQCAKTLSKKLRPAECEVVVFSSENHMVFHPLLADVAGASINPDAAAAPLRQMLPGVSCRTERIHGVDLRTCEVEFDDGGGKLVRLGYDHVMIACGAESNLGIIPGMSEHAFAFKVMRDAIDLRQHIVRQMENAEACSDSELRRWYLSFVIVGAGFSGVEVAGEINELVRSSTRFYRSFSKKDISVTLIHSQDQILPEVAPRLREFARKKMGQAGVTVLLNARAVVATREGVELQDGGLLRGATIVCTIGTTTSAIVQRLDVPKEHGRIHTTPEMRIEGQTNAWAIGDCAYVLNAFDRKPSPPTGQFAEREGRQAALNLIRILRGEPTHPFYFKPLGQLCSIGGYQAVVEMLDIRISGLLAWLLWRGVYLFKLPTWSRRIKVGFDWAWDLVFPRDLSFLNVDDSKRVAHAYYRSGDFVHLRGDPARVFSIIEEGEVEVLQASGPSREPQTLAILGKGDFFGEEALLGNKPHETSIRARSAVRLLQLGGELFFQLAGSLAPLREILAKAVTQRSGDFWRRLPLAQTLLSDEPLASLLDPLPSEMLKRESTLAEAIRALNDVPSGQLLVLDSQQRLWGTLDRNGLYQIIARIATAPADMQRDVGQLKLDSLLLGNPVYVALDDSTLVASSTLLDHGISWLPVVRSKDDPRPVGCLRGERISNRLIEKIDQMEMDLVRGAK
jgi:NADH dehydrogenase